MPAMPQALTEEELHDLRERVNIMHFDGGMPLSKAEFSAFADFRRQQKDLFPK